MTPPGQTGGAPATGRPGARRRPDDAPNLESGMTPPGQTGGAPVRTPGPN